ncbi:MAG: hypothetical protein FJ100_21420 [Deltaproteobacteria bacterium]|nr:hypothetical protein [Deltaproteobacteria bacterium]
MRHGGQLTLRDDPELTARILASIPVSEQAFLSLLGLLRIGACDDIGSACVTLGARSRLMVNPGFVANYCRTDEALSTLIMHELYHVLLGHTRLFARATPLDNLAFDAVINAHLSQRFPTPGRLALFFDTYKADALPHALLRPPEGWPDEPRWILPGELGALHRRLYTPEGGTCLEVYQALRKVLPKVHIDLSKLLGSHGDGQAEDSNGVSEAIPCDDPAVRRILDEILARWPAARMLGGRDAGAALSDLEIDCTPPPPPLAQAVRAAVMRVAGVDAALHSGAAADGMATSVAPYRDRPTGREMGLELLGETPLFFPSVAQKPRSAAREKVHLYLDVSGSMREHLPAVAGAVQSVSHLVADEVHAFSTEISDVTVQNMRRGRFQSTFGTSIACVAEHMVENAVRRAVVITDGHVGDVPEPLAETLIHRHLRMHAVLTTGSRTEFVEQLRGKATICTLGRNQ